MISRCSEPLTGDGDFEKCVLYQVDISQLRAFIRARVLSESILVALKPLWSGP